MGVSGAGKSTVGTALARESARPFLDADTLHPAASIAKMAAGEALTDEDRYPWLGSVGEWLATHPDGVVSCSALKRIYRDRLRAFSPSVCFVHLDGAAALIGRRLAARSGHFMPPKLLQSQFDTLEPLEADGGGLVVELTASLDVQHAVRLIRAFAASSASGGGGC